MDLIHQLKQIPDHRKTKGKRHELWLVLTLMILGFICGYQGYRPLASFVKSFWEPIRTLLDLLENTRQPSYSTFRRISIKFEFDELTLIFNQWSLTIVGAEPGQWLSGDGKSINCTLCDSNGSEQNFISTISLSNHEPGAVASLATMQNKKVSEIVVIRQLIQQMAGIEVNYTLDALHCQKETVELIVKQKQHYLIGLKGNQKFLYKTAQALSEQAAPKDVAITTDWTHKREVTRKVSVYDAPEELKTQWANLTSIIWVERFGIRDGKPFAEKMGYISDLDLSAVEFLKHIQDHWKIENRLHWVRDMTFSEDQPPRRGGNAPVNWALLNCWVISIIRMLGHRTIPDGLRALANQVEQVFKILTQGFSSV